MEAVTDEPDVTQALEVVPHDILVQRAPARVLAEAKEAAMALQEVIKNKKRPVIMNGEQYLEFEDWQTLGRFYGVTSRVSRTSPVSFAEALGFEATADAIRSDGMVISSADAMCMDDEPNWKGKPSYQLRSMAQTRACAKSLRNVLAWVVVLAGYKPTPAEEMSGVNGDKSQAHTVADDVPKCPECNGAMWDNRATKKGRQPDFKCKDKACNKAVWVDGAAKSEAAQLKLAVVDQCRLLNEHGDDIEWSAVTLNEYSIKHFGARSDQLELQPLRDLVKQLSLRYDDLRKKPQGDDVEEAAKAAEIKKIRAKHKPEDITNWLRLDHKGKTLEDLTLDQLLTADDGITPF